MPLWQPEQPLLMNRVSPSFCTGGKCVRLSFEEAIERRIRGDQRCFEYCDRLLRVGQADGVGLVGKRLGKRVAVTWNSFKLGGDMLRRRGHFHRVDHGTAGLLLQILGAAVPELRGVENRVQDCRRIATAMLPAVTE